MKTVIYYYSKSGHTKNYAESLASRIDCNFYSYKEMKYSKLKDFDTIIFMAPVFGGKIQKLKYFLKLYKKIKDKNLIIVAVGMQPSTPERRESMITVNLLDDYHIRLYELMGGFNAQKLPWYLRKAMKIGLKMAARDPEVSSKLSMLGNIFEIPYEYNDINGIEKIMNTIHKLERESNIV